MTPADRSLRPARCTLRNQRRVARRDRCAAVGVCLGGRSLLFEQSSGRPPYRRRAHGGSVTRPCRDGDVPLWRPRPGASSWILGGPGDATADLVGLAPAMTARRGDTVGVRGARPAGRYRSLSSRVFAVNAIVLVASGVVAVVVFSPGTISSPVVTKELVIVVASLLVMLTDTRSPGGDAPRGSARAGGTGV